MNKKTFLKKIAELGCTANLDLEDESYKTIEIIAPKNKNFGGNHTMLTSLRVGKVSDLFQRVYDDLVSAMIEVSDCEYQTCGSWYYDSNGENGYCEYWNGKE